MKRFLRNKVWSFHKQAAISSEKSVQWTIPLKLRLHDAIYRLRFYSNSLIHILSLPNSHNTVASLQKNRGDRSHRVIVGLRRSGTILRTFYRVFLRV